jgi:putative phosphoesterase
LSRVTDEFRQICDHYCSDADRVIHLGDWARGTVLDYLENFPLDAVAGNMDGLDITGRLPRKRVLRLGRFRIGIIHGWGAAIDLQSRIAREFDEVDAILFGHTHSPLATQVQSIFWFNPGSVLLGRGNHPRTLGILHIDDRIHAEIINL